MKALLALTLALTLSACMTLDTRELVAKRASAAEVEAKLGRPAETAALPNGEKVLFYPTGRDTVGVVLGADGRVKEAGSRLSKDSLAKLVPGTSTTTDVRALLGPPGSITRMDRLQRDVWEYFFRHYEELRVMWVQFSYDGVVREALDMLDWSAYPPSGDSGAMP